MWALTHTHTALIKTFEKIKMKNGQGENSAPAPLSDDLFFPELLIN